jgi:hypothetical protein
VGVLELVLHLLHLARLLLQGLLVTDQLLVDLGARLASQHVLQLQEQFFFIADEVFLGLNLLGLCY